jgi:hypothetical protein
MCGGFRRQAVGHVVSFYFIEVLSLGKRTRGAIDYSRKAYTFKELTQDNEFHITTKERR